jgi:hypothetical protein
MDYTDRLTSWLDWLSRFDDEVPEPTKDYNLLNDLDAAQDWLDHDQAVAACEAHIANLVFNPTTARLITVAA